LGVRNITHAQLLHLGELYLYPPQLGNYPYLHLTQAHTFGQEQKRDGGNN